MQFYVKNKRSLLLKRNCSLNNLYDYIMILIYGIFNIRRRTYIWNELNNNNGMHAHLHHHSYPQKNGSFYMMAMFCLIIPPHIYNK
jgi:hypothetical protein